MGKLLENFVENFQDMYVVKTTTIESFPDNITGVELILLEKQLESLRTQLFGLSELTRLATEETVQEYAKTIEILEGKINYVSEVSNILMYINSFYDMSNVVDIQNYNLRSDFGNNQLVYDNTQKGLSLRNISTNYQCSKVTLSGSSVVFYNTNLSYHSGVSLESPYLNLIGIKSVTIRKTDGTVINLSVTDLNEGTHYLKHDLLSSTQIVVEFYNDITTLPLEVQKYYNSLRLSLIDYTYEGEGSVVLPESEYSAAEMFNFITEYDIPSDCFINNLVAVDLLDINDNKITTLNLTLPIGNPTVCRRLDNLDYNLIEIISGIYINNKYRSNVNNSITVDYLKTLANKNEIYIVYIPKSSTVDQANKFIRSLNNQGFVINRRNVKKLKVSMCIEMLSFNKNLSPVLNTLVGVTKNE